jgi:hypothetical protein
MLLPVVVNPLLVALVDCFPRCRGSCHSVGLCAFQFMNRVIISRHECWGLKWKNLSIGVWTASTGVHALGNDFNLRALPPGGRTISRKLQDHPWHKKLKPRKLLEESENGNTLPTEIKEPYESRNVRKFGRRVGKRNAFFKEQESARQRSPPRWKRLWNRDMMTTTTKKDQPVVLPTEIEHDDNPNLLQNRPWARTGRRHCRWCHL